MTARPPALVGISHGTSSEAGRAAVRGLHDAVASAVATRHPDAPPSVRLGHVDVEQPDVPATLASLEPDEPAVVVPLLLSAGYHVHVDLTEAVDTAASARPVVLADALGPDDRLAQVLVRRLVEAGLRDDDRIVLAVAGSSDRRAVDDCHDMARRLAAASRHDVSIGFLSAAEPRLDAAVQAARAASAPAARVVVANYLLAPGYFDDLARAAGADVTARPLLVDDEAAPTELVELVLDRYAAASARLV
ncbi:sirohydrochlorin chelatase [Agromyces bauzanensis]